MRVTICFCKEEQYKGHVIQVTTEKDNSVLSVEATLQNTKWSERLVKQIDWQIRYTTPQLAEKAGLLIAKKWIDVGMLNL